ncbi:TetR/AcrR family transcriptional regulator [Nodosilinea sp. PGN35]|uniref:TetR/AcrR family transcriptional regulator n=1 Tax=Nodosilinea sp. PGN35 TaxID=3020489 RepID=UPI0023B2AAA7|nr:TetR/AcrR family transcriptional regulator [Nodosilinea sp. TSF1-S3]MDF0369936.1 TetR/AcrR family transcriptional regulator [Nodosilinea sp. TSF1-S3]
MSKAQLTRAHIVEQAAALFNQQGFAGASMADLMRATGLQKGGIYNHFRSKDELALAAFDFAVDRIQQRFRGALQGQRHAVDRLMAMLAVYEDFIVHPPLRGGCPLLNTAVDSDDAHPALRARTQQAMNRWRSLIERIVTKGVARGELQPTADPETVASVLIATIEGGILLSKLYSDPSHLDRALNHLATYVQHQLARPQDQKTRFS